ncbi:MAG: 6,7-dimethyl-8-ribityllumazine synthase [uncultured bacterium]|nr:MAG: 6,7-dimethyl-8-ribityllumazine synthase [uncultured bacterium]HBR71917.1 6,7-dimethyl-8-ribityllumazine synthase [Candidatus Moranbacteria bacterium]
MQRKNNKEEEIIDGKKLKIGIVVAKFNADITGGMLQGAIDVLERNNVKKENIEIVYCPGSFEVPLVCQKLALKNKYDGIVAIGCLIKGETDHYHYIANTASKGIMDVSLKFNIPIGFGIITVNNLKQANDRSGKTNNKGAESAQAILDLMRRK